VSDTHTRRLRPLSAHTAIYVSSYYGILQYTNKLNVCPHTTTSAPLCMHSSICVLILPYTTIYYYTMYVSSYDFALSLQLRRRKAEGVGGGLSRSGGVGDNFSYFRDDGGGDRGGGLLSQNEYLQETATFRGAGGAAASAFSRYCCFTAALLLIYCCFTTGTSHAGGAAAPAFSKSSTPLKGVSRAPFFAGAGRGGAQARRL
jgi:hypothetical protein